MVAQLKQLNVGIIGGGYAGMAAAVTLAQHNIPVTVFESAKQLGGRARGLTFQETQLDNGQHILLGCYRQLIDLIELVGGNVEQDFLRLPLQLTLHNRFELKAPRLPAPLHLLVALFTAKGLLWAERWQATRFMFAMRKIQFTLATDITVLELLRQQGQSETLIRLMWEPICIAALNTPANQASAQILLNVLRDSLNGTFSASEMWLPRIDFSALFPNRAADFVRKHGGQVITSCGVECIIPHQNTVELQTGQGSQHFSHVICAASPRVSAQLFRAVPALLPVAETLEKITFQPIYTVYLQYPAHTRLPQPMLGLDGCASQWVFDKGQISAQHGLIAVVISAEGAHQHLSAPLLIEKVKSELNQQIGINSEPIWQQLIAEKRATFCCEVNLKRPETATPHPRVFLAGDATSGDYPATLEGAVRSGRQAALQISRETLIKSTVCPESFG
jgi:squalene-associated FAD-dependent desaturase